MSKPPAFIVGLTGVGSPPPPPLFLQLTANNDNTAIIITKIFKMFLLVMMTLLYNLILNEQAFELEDLPNKKPARLQAK